MLISEEYKVSFDEYIKDLIEQALGRMLSQHYGKCVLRQFVSVFMDEVQVLYDAIIDMQKLRSVYYAEGENLAALGRIVGEPRNLWMYDDSNYLMFDKPGQTPDLVPVWCKYAELGSYTAVDDSQYRLNVIARAIKNHTLTSSVNELAYVIRFLLNVKVSFVKTGPNQVNLIVHEQVSTTALLWLTESVSDNIADDRFTPPYPATLNINKVTFAPGEYLRFDTETSTPDSAPVAVGLYLN